MEKRTGKSRTIWHDNEGVYGGNSESEEFKESPVYESGNQSNEGGSVSASSAESGSKKIRLSPESHLQDENVDSSGQSSPLGLRLTKTPSFKNLLEMKLSNNDQTNCLTQPKIGSIQNNNRKRSVHQQYKASNFPAMFIKIGAWEKIAIHEGDIVAKLYYAKRKLVWELLDGALKRKLEIQWSDILSIRAILPDNEPGTLEIELNQPPSFFRETNPQPRKHTLWQQCHDFTGGQAPIWRRHYVRFPPGVLDKHYDQLLLCDERLRMLSYKPFPSNESPYFDPNTFINPAFFLNFNANRSTSLPIRQHPCSGYPPTTSTLPLGLNSNSTVSVMDFLHTNENVENYPFVTQKQILLPNGANFTACNGGRDSTLVNSMPQPCSLILPPHYLMENAGRSNPSTAVLDGIRNHLLVDIDDVFSYQRNPQPKLEPMCSLLKPLDVIAENNMHTHLMDLDYQDVGSSQPAQNDARTALLDDPLCPEDLNQALLMEPSLTNSCYPQVLPELADNEFSTQNYPKRN